MNLLDWKLDEEILRLTIIDMLLNYIEDVIQSDNRFCCDVNLRVLVQLICRYPIDPDQMNKLSKYLNAGLVKRVERDHRPKAIAAIEDFRQFYQDWVNAAGGDDRE
jgi:hypothetical protein